MSVKQDTHFFTCQNFGKMKIHLLKCLLWKNSLQNFVQNIKSEKKLKLSKFGTFTLRKKKSRIGRNPKTKESKMISSRDVVLFKPSKEFKEFINLKDNG